MIDKEDNPYEAPKTSDFEQTEKNKFTIFQEFWLELIVFFIVSLFVTQHLSSPISRSIESFFGITNLPYKDYILVSTILFIVVICVLYFSIFFLISYVYFKFPHSTSITSSKHGNMRELRVQSSGKPLRVLYAFDPRRCAILLIGGDKTGGKRWYDKFVPIADRLYDEHLLILEQENGKKI